MPVTTPSFLKRFYKKKHSWLRTGDLLERVVVGLLFPLEMHGVVLEMDIYEKSFSLEGGNKYRSLLSLISRFSASYNPIALSETKGVMEKIITIP